MRPPWPRLDPDPSAASRGALCIGGGSSVGRYLLSYLAYYFNDVQYHNASALSRQ